MNIWEENYLNLVDDILQNGVVCPDRTGIGCKKLLNKTISIDLSKGYFPASTVRLVGARVGFEEFWAFLNGVVMIDKHLREKNVTYTTADGIVQTIWTGNTSREFLNSRGLHYLPEGHLGKGYGFQFRHWNGRYREIRSIDTSIVDYTQCYGGVDQIQNVWNNLKNDPYSRRHVVTLLNPEQESSMAITPCWHTHKFTVVDNTLHLSVISRSADVLYGTPTNVQQYSLYLIAMAKSLNYNVGTLHCLLEDAHVYTNQIEFCQELLDREIYDSPTVDINKSLNSLDDVLSLQWSDLKFNNLVVNKKPFETKKPQMAV